MEKTSSSPTLPSGKGLTFSGIGWGLVRSSMHLTHSLTLVFCLLAGGMFPLKAADYHVDSQSGNDAASGLSTTQTWRSLNRVNQMVFQPGDRLLFRSGSHFEGQLAPRGSGTEKLPIQIDCYGPGPLPSIHGAGRVRDTMLLRNVSFWQAAHLEITNQGSTRGAWRTGVRLVAEDFGTMRGIRLKQIFVHDVNGDLRKSHEGCGIYFETLGHKIPSNFEDLIIEECRVLRADRNGICQRNGSGPRSQRVVIRNNLLEDIGGDGIKPWGCDGPLVEHNILRGGRMRCEDHAAGIWPFDCDDAIIQHNEVSGMRGDKDGQGFDSDYRSRRSLFQYNYSHDNEGGFMLICSPGNSYNDGTVIRYNISQNDGIASARVFQFGGKATRTRIYHNTIYVGKGRLLPMVLCGEWNGGTPDGIEFNNNLFYVDGKVNYQLGPAKNVTFSHNLFFGHHDNRPRDPFALTACPELRSVGSGASGFASLSGYLPLHSATFPRGGPIPDHGGHDLFGTPIPAGKPPAIGALEPR